MQTGLTLFLTFNNPVLFYNTSLPNASDTFLNSFNFRIGRNATPGILLDNRLSDMKYAKFFLGVNDSFVNTTVTSSTNAGDTVYTQTNGIARQLTNSLTTLPF